MNNVIADLAEKDMQLLHDELMEKLTNCGLLELIEKYYMKRAECASRSLQNTTDTSRMNMVVGQITICHETADEARRTREAIEAKATAKKPSAISVKIGQSCV